MSSFLHRIDEDPLLFALRSFLTNNEVGPRDFINLACASKYAHAFVEKHWQFLKPDMGTSHRARFVCKLEEYHRQRMQSELGRFPLWDHRRQMVLEVTGGGEWMPPPPSASSPRQQHEQRLAANVTTHLLPPPWVPGQMITSIRLLGVAAAEINISLYSGGRLVHLGGDVLPLFADADGSLELMHFVRYLPPAAQIQMRVTRDANAVVTVANATVTADPGRWWIQTYFHDEYCASLVETRTSFRWSSLPFNGVAEYITFHLIDNDATRAAIADATTLVVVAPSLFTLEFNGCAVATLPAWSCRHTKKRVTSGTSESLRYYYRIPMEKRINFSQIDNIRLIVHFDPPLPALAHGVLRFQVGAMVYNILTQDGSFIEPAFSDV